MNRPTDLRLSILAQQWDAAKAREAEAKAERIKIEEEIISITGKRDAGQMTVDNSDAKITVKTNISYSFDWDKWDSRLAGLVPEEHHPIKEKRELDEAKIKTLREDKPALYAIVAQALTKKENKPTLDITLR